MKIIISSSKTMVEKPSNDCLTPLYQDKATFLINKFINDSNFNFVANQPLTKAIEAYNGVVYRQFKDLLTNQDCSNYLKKHLYILSGLYGLLRANDGINTYRLEMGSNLKIDGTSLYRYWQDDLYLGVNDQCIINLASEEYGKCLRKYLKEDDLFIDLDFLIKRKGELKRISSEVKKARGQMLRYMMLNKIEDYNLLKDFKINGYKYMKETSSITKMVFIKEDE